MSNEELDLIEYKAYVQFCQDMIDLEIKDLSNKSGVLWEISCSIIKLMLSKMEIMNQILKEKYEIFSSRH